MNVVTYLLISLRSAALAIDLAGRSSTADTLYSVADAVESGRATEEHMKLVAEKLKTRDVTDADWSEVLGRIEADSAELREGG